MLVLLADSLCYKVLVANRGPPTSAAPAEPSAEPQIWGARRTRRADQVLPEAASREQHTGILTSVEQGGQDLLEGETAAAPAELQSSRSSLQGVVAFLHTRPKQLKPLRKQAERNHWRVCDERT